MSTAHPGPGRPSPRPVRISDVAAAAGVSKALVSYALNGRSGVSEATRERIVATARSLGWTPSIRARALSRSRAFAVGLVFRKDPRALAADQYYTSLMAGMQAVLSARGYSLVTEVVPDPDAEAAAYRRLARDGRVDGVVVADLRDDDPRFGLVWGEGLASVSLGTPPAPADDRGMPVLWHDERPAVEAVVDHLVALGHRRIAIVAGPQDLASARERREAYQRAMRSRGLGEARWVAGDYTPEGGARATAVLLDDPSRARAAAPPTAVVYANDSMAIGGLGEAASRGLRVGVDLGVVGWDDIGVAEHLAPGLSTVRQYPFEDGGTAAAALLDAIEGRSFAEPIRTADPRFVARGSTGPAPAG